VKDGYQFTITVPTNPLTGGLGVKFLARATPFAPGVTGSQDCQMDQALHLRCSPNPLADAGRRQMFSAIHIRAAHDLGALLVQMPDALGNAVSKLQNRKTIPEVFGDLDHNGDGTLTVDEVFMNTGLDAVDRLLPYIENQMQFGVAGENISLNGGITVAGLASSFVGLNLDGAITDGTSNTILGNVPAVQIAGFCDGSVRPVGSVTPAPFTHWSLNSHLDAVSADPGNFGWTGPITLTHGDGSTVNVILIGLLLPAVQGNGQTLNGLLVTQDGIGSLAGAPGTGQVSINFSDGVDGFFTASLSSKPFVRSPTVQ